MKHLLLIILLCLGFNSFTQNNPCEPDQNYQDSTFGLWPDTIENLPLAVKDEYYEEHIQIKTPATVGEVMGDPYNIDVLGFPVNIAPLGIDSIKLVDIENLPSVISTYLSNPDSVFGGNAIACVTLFGTPSMADVGQHDISIVINGWVNVAGLGTVSLYDQLGEYYAIEGYKLIVQNSSSIKSKLSNRFDISQNSPNPFSDLSLFELYSPNNHTYSFRIIDMTGRIIYDENIHAKAGANTIEIDASAYPSGFYFYSISDGQHLVTKKLMITGR